MFDVCVIGHVTRDAVRVNGEAKEMPGGTAYYASIAMKSLGMNVAVITRTGKEDKPLLDDIKREGIPIFWRESPGTTAFTNIYSSVSNDRRQIVSDIALPFDLEDVEGIQSMLFHLGPLTKGDIPLELAQYLSERSKISLDVQGFLRSVDKSNGSVTITDWERKEEFLPLVNVLKASEEEARVISGEKDLEEMAIKLSKCGPEEVIITRGSKGSLLYYKSRLYWIPSLAPGKWVDPTGCGDTYMAGYLYLRTRTNDFGEIGKFAARVASLKLESYGPLRRRDPITP